MPPSIPVQIKKNTNDKLRLSLERAAIPQDMTKNILKAEDAFVAELNEALKGDPLLYKLIDKKTPFETLTYQPEDLVELTNEGAFRVPRKGMLLRYPAAVALEAMAQDARKDGITLVASSTYRSYQYQSEVYARNVRSSGQETADRESARPGHSQHQLGLVIDFGSITDEFAETDAGKWLVSNAADYGWSLSFPAGYEKLTGYRWESWHYRYVGKPLSRFIDKWFSGVQQYTLQFINEWQNYDKSKS